MPWAVPVACRRCARTYLPPDSSMTTYLPYLLPGLPEPTCLVPWSTVSRSFPPPVPRPHGTHICGNRTGPFRQHNPLPPPPLSLLPGRTLNGCFSRANLEPSHLPTPRIVCCPALCTQHHPPASASASAPAPAPHQHQPITNTSVISMAAPAADVALLIRSENSASERRVSPAWTIAQLKARLEPITGVPAGCQRLSLKVASQPAMMIEAADEEATQVGAWPLQAYAELQVGDD